MYVSVAVEKAAVVLVVGMQMYMQMQISRGEAIDHMLSCSDRSLMLIASRLGCWCCRRKIKVHGLDQKYGVGVGLLVNFDGGGGKCMCQIEVFINAGVMA